MLRLSRPQHVLLHLVLRRPASCRCLRPHPRVRSRVHFLLRRPTVVLLAVVAVRHLAIAVQCLAVAAHYRVPVDTQKVAFVGP